MKKYVHIFAVLIILYCQSSFAQKKISILEMITNEIEERLSPKKEQHNTYPPKNPRAIKTNNSSLDDNKVIEIPVVFHVVHDTVKETQVNKNHFQTAIDYLNMGFNNVNPKSIDPTYRDLIGKANIHFDFASKLLGIPKKNDITFHETDEKYFIRYNVDNKLQLYYDKKLKSNGYQDSNRVLNIWVCHLKDEKDGGYSSLPQENNNLTDGVVIDIDSFFSTVSTTRLWVLNHEVGHFLGLFHIWGDGEATSRLNKCNSLFNNDDSIEDTPPQPRANLHKDVKERNFQKTCDGTKFSNYQNFMDNSGVYGMFTKGQVKRMREQIRLHRPGFLNGKVFPQETSTAIGSSTITSSPKTTINTNAEGEVCFSNPNMYSRKIILTNIKTGISTSIVVGLAYYPKSTTRCAYNLDVGIYDCKIYTTFTNTLTEDFQLKITSSSQEIKITKDGFN